MRIRANLNTLIANLPLYDGTTPVELWKIKHKRDIKRLTAQESSLMQARDAQGKPLYRLTSGGNLSRVNPLSTTTRRKAIERDGVCVWCCGGAPFEVDHIKRYIDGGSNNLSNLQTLCVPCHRSKGGL